MEKTKAVTPEKPKRHRRTKAEIAAAKAEYAAKTEGRAIAPKAPVTLKEKTAAKFAKLITDTEAEISRLHSNADGNKARDEKLIALRGARKTYDTMKNILDRGYSTSKVMNSIDTTRKETMQEICTIQCRLNGNQRKPTEQKERLSELTGIYTAIQKVKLILDDAFME